MFLLGACDDEGILRRAPGADDFGDVPPTSGGSERAGSTPASPSVVDLGTSLTATDIALGAFPIGLTSDDYLVFGRYDRPGDAARLYSLEVMPVGGGMSTVLSEHLEEAKTSVAISGGVVGWWTGVSDPSRAVLGHFSYWSHASGTKAEAAASSAAQVFAGSADGTHVMFTRDATATSGSLVYTSTATPDAPAVLGDAEAVVTYGPIGACSLGAQVTKANDLVLLACRVGDAEPREARLTRVAADGTVSVLVPSGLGETLYVDASGTNAFVAGATDFEGLLAPLGGGQATPLGEKAWQLRFSKDGTTAVYQSSTAVRRLDLSTMTRNTLVASTWEIWDVDRTFTKMLLASSPIATSRSIAVIDTTTTEQTPLELARDVTPLGFTASGAYVLYLDSRGTIFAKASGGGAEEKTLVRSIGSANFVVRAGEGDSFVTRAPSPRVGELWYANAATGAFGRFAVDTLTAPGQLFTHGKRAFYGERVKGTTILRSVELP